MQKDTKPNIEEAMDGQKKDGIPGDEMAALERQLVPSTNDAGTKDSTRRLGFVSAGVESQTDGVPKVSANNEDIELPDESDSDDDSRVEITQKDIPEAVYGGIRKRKGDEDDDDDCDDDAVKNKEGDNHLGALERMKRMRRGG